MNFSKKDPTTSSSLSSHNTGPAYNRLSPSSLETAHHGVWMAQPRGILPSAGHSTLNALLATPGRFLRNPSPQDFTSSNGSPPAANFHEQRPNSLTPFSSTLSNQTIHPYATFTHLGFLPNSYHRAPIPTPQAYYFPEDLLNVDFDDVNTTAVTSDSFSASQQHHSLPIPLSEYSNVNPGPNTTNTIPRAHSSLSPSAEQPRQLSVIPRMWESHRFTRPPITWIPDCPVTFQDTFKPAGILWASTYECKWIGCRQTIHRNTTSTCEAYLRLVYDHFTGHAKAIPEGLTHNGCGWEGCELRTKSQHGLKQMRNKMRHIVTHLPWYTLCTKCAKISARRDARGGKNPCVQKECWASAGIASRVLLAHEEGRQSGKAITISRFSEVIFEREA